MNNIFKKMWKKKGVSPLIATVLLIAFAVSLGAVVMNWGRGYVESTAEQAEAQSAEKIACSMDTSLDVVQVGNNMKLCIDNATSSTYLNFTLINSGSIPIKGLQISEIRYSGAFTQTSYYPTTAVAKSKLVYTGVNLTGTFSTIEQVEIAPIILIRGVEVVCLEHSIRKLSTEIGVCS